MQFRSACGLKFSSAQLGSDGAVGPVLLLAVFVVVSPLVAFAAYYALWHSTRKGAETRAEVAEQRALRQRDALAVISVPAAVASVLALLAGGLLVVIGSAPPLSTALVGCCV